MAQKKPSKHIQVDADLTALNTLGVTAKAKKLIDISSVDQLKELHADGLFDRENPFILGGGSNILLKGDVSQTVLKISLKGISVSSEDKNSVIIDASAGVNWHNFTEWSVNNNFGGIENLALIPGTVGAAPIQNIGAYGVELKDVLETVSVFNLKTGSEQLFSNDECKFGYRDSIFKNELNGRVIVTSIRLKLTKPPHEINSSYRSLSEYLQNKQIKNPSIKDLFDAVVAIRKSKLPDPKLIGNAGSF
ncbi:MAG: UDP-N-acetylmuramate dehydrogenase, partial [Balneolaceae bacterium]|nr:UDP-N-acetylmuramate dehydrogenase [Balneolaceae bacterium]